MSPSLRRLSALVLCLTALGACSSGSDNSTAAPSTAASGSSLPAPATQPDTTPSSTSTAAPTTTLEPTTTTEVPVAVYPLLGTPMADPALGLRPVVVAKVGNYDSHPPSGLNAADIVYEEIINDNVSRFAAAYQSQPAPVPVGPIRSGRRQDVDLLGSFNAPILAWAGGNGTVTREIDNSDLVDLSQNHCKSACFRVTFDKAPYNLYFDIAKAWDVAAGQGGSPAQQFRYRKPGDPAPGVPATGLKVTLDSYTTEWTWNATTGLYERHQNGHLHKERSGELITTNNVVVLVMNYAKGISGSPDAQSTGSGELFVLTGGNVVHGTWTRPDRLAAFQLTADDGSVIALSPGRTFIQLPRTGGNVAAA